MKHARSFAIVVVFAVIALIPSQATRASCLFKEPDELTSPDVVELNLPPVFIREAPAGGLWWMHVPINDLGEVCTNLVYRDGDGAGSTVEVETVKTGPRVLALRVPATLAVGTRLRMSAVCGDGERTELASLEVIAGSPPEHDAPAFILEERSLFDWIEPACNDAGQNLRDTHRFATLLSFTTETEAKELLLDVWLLEVGAARPSDDQARAADSALWQPSSRTLIVRDPGTFDLHARATDPGTGATSDAILERIATPEPTAVQCGSPPGGAALIALAVLLLPRRQRRYER